MCPSEDKYRCSFIYKKDKIGIETICLRFFFLRNLNASDEVYEEEDEVSESNAVHEGQGDANQPPTYSLMNGHSDPQASSKPDPPDPVTPVARTKGEEGGHHPEKDKDDEDIFLTDNAKSFQSFVDKPRPTRDGFLRMPNGSGKNLRTAMANWTAAAMLQTAGSTGTGNIYSNPISASPTSPMFSPRGNSLRSNLRSRMESNPMSTSSNDTPGFVKYRRQLELEFDPVANKAEWKQDSR